VARGWPFVRDFLETAAAECFAKLDGVVSGAVIRATLVSN